MIFTPDLNFVRHIKVGTRNLETRISKFETIF
jgi:hypothetical protein